MNILEKIILNKTREVALLKEQTAFSDLEKSRLFSRATFSLSDFILNHSRSGIIAEFKRKSPSGGILNSQIDMEYVTKGYSDAGASGLSILTDNLFFGGSCTDILQSRDHVRIPVMRKEFIIDEIQVLESKAAGADAILLIASVLDKDQILRLATLSRSLNMEVLLEIHSAAELENVNEFVNIIGVNNRDLGTLTTNINLSVRLADKIPGEFVKISESGISNAQTVIDLRNAGYNGFLIGEYFMSKPDPVIAFADFVKKIK
jgi:indole-3-glycerol phosphate synthase